jgi:hypothetical protein
VEGLKKSNAVEKKKQYEQMLISKNPGIKTTIDQLTQNIMNKRLTIFTELIILRL